MPPRKGFRKAGYFEGPMSADRLRSLVNYDGETGEMTWAIHRGGKATIGSKIGTKNITGYLHVKLMGVTYPVHRLAWLYVKSEWPKQFIDHINGDKSDNRISNLREAGRAQNAHNSPAQKNNKLGIKGVDFYKGKYRAQTTVNQKKVFLGYFATADEAAKAYGKYVTNIHNEYVHPSVSGLIR